MSSGLGAGYDNILGPLDATIGEKLATYHRGDTNREKRKQPAEEKTSSNKEKFEVNKELLYDGQGKLNDNVTSLTATTHMKYDYKDGQEGLQAPNISATGEAVI